MSNGILRGAWRRGERAAMMAEILDGKRTARDVAQQLGLPPSTVYSAVYRECGGKGRRRPRERVPVRPFALAAMDAVEGPGKRFTWSELAFDMGWVDSYGRGDCSRLRRRLGFVPYTSDTGRYYSRALDLDTAAALLRALGLDPIDFDI